jgi:hypothetical protein
VGEAMFAVILCNLIGNYSGVHYKFATNGGELCFAPINGVIAGSLNAEPE